MKFNVPVSRFTHTKKEFRFDKVALVTGLLSLAEKIPELGREYQAHLVASSKVIATEMSSADCIFVPILEHKESL